MSVIIRLQNLPWSANAMDIRTFFRGLSIPEGGVHIVGGEQGDAFIAFSTDEDARQAMMLDGGRLKEVQIKLLLSSRSEMHKVIEQARQQVPVVTLPPPPPMIAPIVQAPIIPMTPFTPALSTLLQTRPAPAVIPGLGSPGAAAPPPQPAVIEPPAPVAASPPRLLSSDEDKKKDKDRSRRRSRSKSREREKSSRRDRDKKERRDRSRSRDRRRRSRSRDRDRRDRRRDRRDRSREPESRRSRDTSDTRATVDRSTLDSRAPVERAALDSRAPVERAALDSRAPVERAALKKEGLLGDNPYNGTQQQQQQQKQQQPQRPVAPRFPLQAPNAPRPFAPFGNGEYAPRPVAPSNGFPNNQDHEALNRLHEIGNKRNPHAFQGSRMPQGFCIRLKDVPTDTGYGDIRRFFSGYLISNQGVKMINDNMGRRSGVVLVRFSDSSGKAEALKRNGWPLRERPVKIEHIEDAEYEEAVDSFLPVRSADNEPVVFAPPKVTPNFTILRFTELPPFVKEHDIIKKLSEYSLLSINMTDCRDTKTRTAYVQFAKPEDARIALERRNQIGVFGRKNVKMSPCTEAEYEKAKRDQLGEEAPVQTAETPRDPRQRRINEEEQPPLAPGPAAAIFPPTFAGPLGFPVPPAQATAPFVPVAGFMPPNVAWPPPLCQPDCVLIKGLSPRATDRTIINFFTDVDAVPARIHLMLDQSGRPSGDCFCEFRTPEHAARAVSKHGILLEGQPVTVELVERRVVEEALEGPKQEPNFIRDKSPMRFEPRGPPSFQPRGFRGRGGFDRGRGGPRGAPRGGFEFGMGRGRGFRGGPRGSGPPRGGFNSFNGGGGGARGEEAPEPEGFGEPGCVVSLENVPYRSEINEILDFFSDFDLTQDDVIRRFNDRGFPTGDARVAFRTPFDAQRAVQTKNMQQIRGRNVTVSIV